MIAFDIGFLEPDDAADDRALARAIEASGAAVVLGYFFHMDAAALAYAIDATDLGRRLRSIDDSKYPVILAEDPDMTNLPLSRATRRRPTSRRCPRRRTPRASSTWHRIATA